MKNRDAVEQVRRLADEFADNDGRRPRILIARTGQGGHDYNARVMATGFADMGFDVDIGPLFQVPEEIARQSAENDVHIVCVFSLAGAHKTLIPQLIDALKKTGRPDIMVVAGGVIPGQDHEFLRNTGVAFISGSGTALAEMAKEILTKLMRGM